MYKQIKQKPVLALPRGGSIRLKVILVFGLIMVLLACPPVMPSAALTPSVDPDYGNLPLSFLPNVGQSDSAVRFLVHDMGSTIFFTSEHVVLALPSKAESAARVARLRFLGADSKAALTGTERLPGIVNYFIGDDRAGWRTGIPTYAGLVYRQLYPGIDLHYDGTAGRLKGTYVVAPGASPGLIRWQHEGARDIQIDGATGDLLIAFPGSTLIEHAPVAWQEVHGQRVDVTISYDLANDGSVGFEIGRYDPALPLVIDPTISYSTYLGGSGFEEAEGIALDGGSNAYVVGTTTSIDFPDDPWSGYGSGEDVFVVKISASGDALLYTTYLGGDEDDAGNAIVVDNDGSAYVTGDTDSTDFPTENPYQDSCGLFVGVCIGDAFVAKLNAEGNGLVYSTYLGGHKVDEGEGIALDGNGNAYVVGTTFSSDFPTENPMLPTLQGLSDAFVTKLDAGGTLGYSTYLGGSATDFGAAVAVDEGGNAYVAGETTSTDLATLGSVQSSNRGSMDVFAVKLSASGSSMAYGAYLGGSGSDYAYGIALDGAGNAYITGQTESSDFPTTLGAYDTTCGSDGNCDDETGFYSFGDAFAVKLGSDGDSLLYSTFLGGSDVDKGYAIAVDVDGRACVTGDTHSADFPAQNAVQGYGGGADAFVVKLAVDGSALAYSTYLGGSSGDYGTGIAVRAGSALVAGITFSDDFPTESPLQATHGGGQADGFVVKLEDEAGPPLPEAPNLQSSDKTASKQYVMPEETLTYIITLRNSGALAATADVTDPVPLELTYVAGSATGGGTCDAGTQTLSWSDVEVDPGEETSLSFMVTATSVATPTPVSNVATIAYDDETLERAASVLLVPEPESSFDLRGSRKTASQYWVAAGERLTYTIRLHNSGNQSATADVKDAVPAELYFVAGSADPSGGVYDSATRTISWSNLQVPPGDSVSLEFAVTAPTVVDDPSLVVNKAVITAGDQALERQAVVLLVPEPVGDDVRSPVVEGLTIGEQDVLTDPAVTLHISATDDVEVTEMYLQEWAWSGHLMEPWRVVQSSGWVPYQDAYDWALELESGVHFVAVWVADEAGNVSHLTRSGLDYASLLLPQETLDSRGFIPYLVHYEAGEDVTATLETISGDADLYVWFPGSFGLPDAYSIEQNTELDQVAFTTPQSGAYLFLVYGHRASTYGLAISPGGGPRTWSAGGVLTSQQASDGEEATSSTKMPWFNVGPIVTLDPLADAEPPEAMARQLQSHKTASRHALTSGEKLTYTILLWNTGTTHATADVTDAVPVEMSYVRGSATGGASYDGSSRTLTWSDVEVDSGEVKPLSFVVTATAVSTPTLVTNKATIATEGSTVEREATVLLWPESSVLDLYLSQKRVSQHVAVPGDVVTYTIQLRNVGTTTSTVTVTDPVPWEMNYLTGSATGGGLYDAGTREVSWSGVEVGPGEEIRLSFAVMVSAVSAPTPVINAATIASERGSFERRAGVVLLPDSAPSLSLRGSRKMASRRWVTAGEVLTYTIWLHNSGRLGVTADVTDPVPPEMAYVSGSVTGGGTYDPGTATLSWSDVTVPPGDSVALTFVVTGVAVQDLTPVVNRATISAGGESFEREVVVLLTSESMDEDVTPPVVESLTIDEQDVLTTRDVVLHILASDDEAVTDMWLKEWLLVTTPVPHWKMVKSSGWMPYEETCDWTLEPESGVHFLGVWVADEAGNVSHLTDSGLDYASLLLPDDLVNEGDLVPYLAYYGAGKDVIATLETVSGDADLYVWFPSNLGLPDVYSIEPGREPDQVTFTAPKAGAYLFLVHGYQTSTYNLSIAPGGGPQAGEAASALVPRVRTNPSAFSQAASDGAGKAPQLYMEQILALSGLDPLAQAEPPRPSFVVYLPLVVR
jgi:uncharacterized repeat protein (TIGR01451 family)